MTTCVLKVGADSSLSSYKLFLSEYFITAPGRETPQSLSTEGCLGKPQGGLGGGVMAENQIILDVPTEDN